MHLSYGAVVYFCKLGLLAPTPGVPAWCPQVYHVRAPLNFNNYRVHTQASQGLSMTGAVWTPRISLRRQSVYWSPAKKDLLKKDLKILELQWSPIFLQENEAMINSGKTMARAVWGTMEKEKTCTNPTVHGLSHNIAAVSPQPHNACVFHARHLRLLGHTVIYCSRLTIFAPHQRRKMHVVRECQDNRA